MADDDEIRADLEAQGLADSVSVEDVKATFGLFSSAAGYDPAWTYDPAASPPHVYAQTAAEMEPEDVPDGWPNV
jgi:hypothetical protein